MDNWNTAKGLSFMEEVSIIESEVTLGRNTGEAFQHVANRNHRRPRRREDHALTGVQGRGYIIVGDSARTIIQDRRRRGLNPRPNAYEFAHETLRMDIENFVHHAATPGHV